MLIKQEVENKLPIKDLSNIYVVADFDRTISSNSSCTSWAVLANSDLVPDSYIQERTELYNRYRPIELDDSMDFDIRSQLVKEWFQKHIELFFKYEFSENIFIKAARDLRIMSFREGAKQFINFLHDNNIPLIIISAGIGNFIEYFFEYNDCFYDNVHVISNKVMFKNGIAYKTDKNIIHPLNKNEVSLPEDIKSKLNNRTNVILLGDQITDLKMVDKSKHNDVLTVCFQTDDNMDKIDDYSASFDILVEKNEDYTNLSKLLFKD